MASYPKVARDILMDTVDDPAAQKRIWGQGQIYFGTGDYVKGLDVVKDGIKSYQQDKYIEERVKPEILRSPGGPPYGIRRGTQVRIPNRPGWTDDDQDALEAALTSYQQGQADLLKRTKEASESRAKAWGKYARAYGVLDDQGNLTMATSAQIQENPTKYAPASQAVQVRNRTAFFGEIDTAVGLLQNAIDQMGDEGFDTVSRAQIALALGSDTPRTAIGEFFRSTLATTLSPAQIDYITGLANLSESALAVRAVGGIGAASDLVRRAIMNMVPGANTPSRPYANRQIQIFQAEVNALRKSIPGLPGQPSGGGQAGTAQAAPKKGTRKKNSSGDTMVWDGSKWVLVSLAK